LTKIYWFIYNFNNLKLKEYLMKKNNGVFLGLAVMLIMAIFTMTGCNTGTSPNTATNGNNTENGNNGGNTGGRLAPSGFKIESSTNTSVTLAWTKSDADYWVVAYALKGNKWDDYGDWREYQSSTNRCTIDRSRVDNYGIGGTVKFRVKSYLSSAVNKESNWSTAIIFNGWE
jgi:hypothetical protein